MKLVAYARDAAELASLRQMGAGEVLLSHEALSRLGSLGDSELHALAREARALDLRPVLDWDILMTAPAFEQAVGVLEKLDLSLFAAIRVQDPGALEYALKKLPGLPIQLVLETGNHNLRSVKRWCEYGGDRLERIVLSIQLPKAKLAEFIQTLPVPVEVMAQGPILLLYTPRPLLSAQSSGASAVASCDENHHSGFRIIENLHGTFVFHSKDYSLMEQLPELSQMGLSAYRMDLRLGATPQATTRCFYQANATDVLFKKLKNRHTQRQDADYVGEVVEISKDSHTIIHVMGKGQTLRKGQVLRFITPEGGVMQVALEWLKDLDQKEVDGVGRGDFAVIPYLKRVTPKSAVYRGELT